MIYLLSETYFSELIKAIKEEFLKEIQIGDIGEQIRGAISFNEVFHVNIGSYSLPFSDTTVGSWIAMLFILVAAIWLGRDFKEIPKGRQVIAEGTVSLFTNLCKNQHMNDKQVESVAPFVGSMAVFICITNLASVFKIVPPAKDPVFAITLAVFTIFYVIFTGIRLVGISGFIGSLKYPQPALIPFKILDYFIKPISLSLRLFGNIFGAFILMEFISIIMPVIVPGILGIWFDLADGILQAGVFSYLSIVYIGEIVEGAHNYETMEKDKLKSNPKLIN